MAARLPLVRIAGRFRQLPSGDYLPVGAGGTGAGSLADLKTALSLDEVSNTADADKPVSTAQQAAISANTQMNPNMLINGNFRVNQRAFAGGALAPGAYGVDRWGAYNGGANYSVSGGLVTLVSGVMCQVIEAPATSSFVGKLITVSVEAPSVALIVTVGNGTGASAATGVITAGGGRRSVTLTVPAGVATTADLKVRLSAASSVTFRRVKVELGSVATAFDDTVDVIKCQRFFQKSYLQETAPGSGGATNYPGMVDYFAPVATTAQINVFVKFPVTMRGVPALTLYDLAGAAGFVYRGGNGQGGNVFAVGDASFNGVATAGVSATEFAFHWAASSEIACTD